MDRRTKFSSYLFDELHQCLFVVLPLLAQLVCRRKLLAAQLECDFKAVGSQVVEVLHATGHRVPGGAVGDATLFGEVLVIVTLGAFFGHGFVLVCVGSCQVSALNEKNDQD